MSDPLSLTTEEWAALLATLGLPEPLGISLLDPDDPVGPAALSMATRSLLGRELLTLDGGDDDIHPQLARLILALCDAEEIVAVTLARPGVITTLAWYAIDGTGVAVFVDPFGNVKLEMAPAAEVVDQARRALADLRATTPAYAQHPVEPAALREVFDALSADEPRPVRLALSGEQHEVELLGTVRGYTQIDQTVTTETVLVVGSPGADPGLSTATVRLLC